MLHIICLRRFLGEFCVGSQAQPLADQAFGGDLGELLGSLTLPLRHVARTPRWIMKYHEVSTSNAKNGSVRLLYIYTYTYIAMPGLTVGGGFADLYLVLFAVLSPMANLQMTPLLSSVPWQTSE